MEQIDWSPIRLVVFDLDGTLYDQSCLRRRMLRELGLYCLRHPTEVGLLRVIGEFRRARERLADEQASNIAQLQYERPAASLAIQPEAVAGVVREWFEERPLRHLGGCRFASIDQVFESLRGSGRQVGVFSDYPVRDKLRALNLEADLVAAAAEPEIDRLKPHPAGLESLMKRTGVTPVQTLMIGDREDRDGACARNAGVQYRIKTPSPQAPYHFREFQELLPGPVGVE
jgi:FMN phosphatase YigB (HAD superfamily)